jgi:hypothetical protein
VTVGHVNCEREIAPDDQSDHRSPMWTEPVGTGENMINKKE